MNMRWRKNMISINKNKLKYILLTFIIMIAFFEPQYFLSANIEFAHKVYSILKYFSLLFSMIFLIIMIKSNKVSKTIIAIAMFLGALLMSTIINNFSLLKAAINYCLNILSMCICMNYLYKKNNESFIIGMRIIFNLLVLINFLSIIIYPSGMYIDISTNTGENWFLGYDNLHILYILPCIFFNCIFDSLRNRKSVISFFMIVVAYASCIIRFSATSIIGISVLLMYFIPFLKKIIIKNYKKIILCILIVTLLIVICRIQNIFQYIIVNLLGKSLTFSGRIFIWDYVMEFIKNKPILGYGYEISQIRFLKTTIYRSYHAHNEILEIIYKTGIVGMLIFCYICLLLKNNAFSIKNINIKALIFTFTIVYLIMFITEYYDLNYFLYLFMFTECLKEEK